jgi:hypothetical protein
MVTVTATAADDAKVTVEANGKDATAADADATVSVDATVLAVDSPMVDLETGPNTILVQATLGGDTRTYTLTVTRASKSDATLKALKLDNDIALSPAFDPGRTSYTASAPYELVAIMVTATLADTNASMSLTAPVDVDLADGAACGRVAGWKHGHVLHRGRHARRQREAGRLDPER